MDANNHHLGTVDAIRAVVGEPHPAITLKVLDSLDEISIASIQKSPFLVLATADKDGFPDVSPKGDEPGFVAIDGPRTLLIPDRKGNRLIYSLQNILSNPLVRHLVGSHHGHGRPTLPAAPDKVLWRRLDDWPEAWAKLQRTYGPWGLAYLETLLRLADWGASAQEQA